MRITVTGTRPGHATIVAHAVQRSRKEPQQTVSHSTGALVRTAEIAEISALAGAVGGYARSVLISDRRETLLDNNKVAIAAARESSTTTQLAFVVPCILVATVARSIASRLEKRGSQSPSMDGAAFVDKTEKSIPLHAAVKSQAAALETISRQIDKLQIRTRLVSRDVRGQLKGVEEVTAGHSVALTEVNERLERVEGDMKDLETLIAALQELSLKQFLLVKDALLSSSRKGGTLPKSQSAPLPTPAFDRLQEEQKISLQSKTNDGNDEWGRPIREVSLGLNQRARSTVVH